MIQEIPIYQLGIYADKYPVTVGEYRKYQPRYTNPWDAVDPDPKLPATGISWQEARVYCEFLGKRLPTTLEWIFCATRMMFYPAGHGDGFELRGTKRQFPWGDETDPKRCNCVELGKKRPTPVDFFDGKGESPFGLSDMMGNVWEMTTTSFGESISGKDLREDDLKTIIGGHFRNELQTGGLVGEGVIKMDMLLEDAGNEIIGFRCVRDFNDTDILMHAADIHKTYHAWCVESGSLTPGRDQLLCDLCGKGVPPQFAKALGSEKHNISAFCDDCFISQGQALLKRIDGNRFVFYGFALGFLIAYMRGDAKGGDYVYREGGFEKYATKCRLRSVRTDSRADIHHLLTELNQSVA